MTEISSGQTFAGTVEREPDSVHDGLGPHQARGLEGVRVEAARQRRVRDAGSTAVTLILWSRISQKRPFGRARSAHFSDV